MEGVDHFGICHAHNVGLFFHQRLFQKSEGVVGRLHQDGAMGLRLQGLRDGVHMLQIAQSPDAQILMPLLNHTFGPISQLLIPFEPR